MDRRDLLMASATLALGVSLPGCASAPPVAARPSGPASTGPRPGADPATALDAFATKLMSQLTPAPANAVFSPFSVAMVLSMVREGAAGDTASELDAVLGAPSLGDVLAVRTRALASARGALRVANCLWGQAGTAWKPVFQDRLAKTYLAPLRESDFAGAPEEVRKEINAWVKTRTAGKIPELVEPGLIGALTRLVLVNALHFKAPWAEPLAEVGKLPFTTAAGAELAVPTLSGSGDWPWWEGEGLVGTAVPCEGGDFALAVVLPDGAGPRIPVPASVFGEVLASPVTPVALRLPAWKLRQKVQLTEVLQQLGVRLAFDANLADFSPMTAAQRLCLDFVVHEATFEVNAKGIEAAAATAAGMRVTGALVPGRELVLDRPFSYALLHVPTRTCLFLGQVADPTSETA